MSNRLSKLVTRGASAPLPVAVSSTVPVTERYVIGGRKPDVALADDRFLQADDKLVERTFADLLVLVTAAGTNTSFIATIEGSVDGLRWYGLQHLVSPAPTGFTINQNGITVLAAIALAGYVLRIPGRFAFYRIGLAGSVAADGQGQFGLTLSRDN